MASESGKIKGTGYFCQKVACPLFILLILSSCAPVVQHYTLVDKYLSQGRYADADSVVEKYRDKYGARNAVLYYLDRAMTLHLSGRYAESNTYLEKAEARMEELYTKSITTETGAMLTNDNLLPYEGEDFEKVMVNVIGAINYVYLHEWDEALVEARKIDHKLNVLNDRYEKKNIYKEDAFARYLTGILYEARGELNDAFIAYRKAYETYVGYQKDYGTPLPPTLPGDLIRITDAMHLEEEHHLYTEMFPNTEWISEEELSRRGEVIFFSYDGRAPVKVDFFIDAPVPDGAGGFYYLRVALPKFVLRPGDLGYVDIKLTDSQGIVASRGMFLVEDIAAIAVKNLEDRTGRISAKAIARATAKFLVARELRKKVKDDPLARFLAEVGTDIYSMASEKSDKRSWQTLPAQIRMTRLAAPPGLYTMVVEYYATNHRLITRKTFPVSIKAGEKRFMSHRHVGAP